MALTPMADDNTTTHAKADDGTTVLLILTMAHTWVDDSTGAHTEV